MKPYKSKIQRVVSSMFALLLTLLFVALYICIGLGFGVFNNRAILGKINESNYYNKVYESLNENAKLLVAEAGFPEEVLTEVITLERVYIAGQNYIEATLGDTDYVIKTDKIKDRLMDNIYQYLLDEGIELTEELDSGIIDLVNRVEADYLNSLQLPFISSVTEYRSDFVFASMFIIPILFVLIGILCYFLIRMFKYVHKGVRYIVYALLSSSILTVGAAGYLLITKQYALINASPDYYQEFLTAYLRWDITVFMYIGGIGLTVAIALISLVGFLKNGINTDK